MSYISRWSGGRVVRVIHCKSMDEGRGHDYDTYHTRRVVYKWLFSYSAPYSPVYNSMVHVHATARMVDFILLSIIVALIDSIALIP